MTQEFKSFTEFYPYYLSEHQDKTCKRLHFIGSGLIVFIAAFALITQQWLLLWLLPVFGYGFAWIGHFFFEHNRPATFKHPLYSLLGDWVMFKDILFGKIKI